jgi:hypothetical protein
VGRASARRRAWRIIRVFGSSSIVRTR